MKSHKKKRRNAVAIGYRRRSLQQNVVRSMQAIAVTMAACVQVMAIRQDRTLTPEQKAVKIIQIAIETAHATTKALTFKF